MKVNKKIKIKIILSILLFFSICLFNSILNLKLNSIENPKYEIDNVNIKTQGFWNLTGTTILIDDDVSGKDWAYHALNYDWCTGTGTVGDPYIIENVYLNGFDANYCIVIQNSRTPYFIIRNCTFLNDNTEFGFGAITLANTDNGVLFNNTCKNSVRGIYFLVDCHNNLVLENTIINNRDGIYIYDGSHANTIYNNTIVQNEVSGVVINLCFSGNEIISNLIKDNGKPHSGIFIRFSGFNLIRNNTITQSGNGISLVYYTFNNSISRNNISENVMNGISIYDDSCNNSIIDNLIMKNTDKGIAILHADPYDNLLYLNKLIGNGVNGRDDSNSFGNFWDNGSIGNFWDDYNGTDANDDGIGDTPYTIAGTYNTNLDNFPIWSTPPEIVINSPNLNDVYGVNAPSFNVSISDTYLDTMWYTINNGIQKVNFTVNGTINQDLWDAQPEGEVIITFYANDTSSNLNFVSIKVIKDYGIPPIISVNSPLADAFYGNIAPNFNVEISDPTLNTSWYSLDGGATNIIFTSNGSIAQNIWDTTPDGAVTIAFYANDSVGNKNSKTVIVQKDINPPVVQINSPSNYMICGVATISFNVEVSDLNLEKMWYTIEGSLINITFTSNTTIDNSLWNSFNSGDLTLIFYANDTLGRLSYKSVTITKDIDAPIINIISPSMGNVFYKIAPSYEISVNEPHLDSMWYSIDEGSTVLMISEISGFISQILWDGAPIGTITLTIYANDTAGNLAYKEVIISKESISPPTPNNTVRGYEIFIFTGTLIIISIIFGKNKFIKKKR